MQGKDKEETVQDVNQLLEQLNDQISQGIQKEKLGQDKESVYSYARALKICDTIQLLLENQGRDSQEYQKLLSLKQIALRKLLKFKLLSYKKCQSHNVRKCIKKYALQLKQDFGNSPNQLYKLAKTELILQNLKKADMYIQKALKQICLEVLSPFQINQREKDKLQLAKIRVFRGKVIADIEQPQLSANRIQLTLRKTYFAKPQKISPLDISFLNEEINQEALSRINSELQGLKVNYNEEEVLQEFIQSNFTQKNNQIQGKMKAVYQKFCQIVEPKMKQEYQDLSISLYGSAVTGLIGENSDLDVSINSYSNTIESNLFDSFVKAAQECSIEVNQVFDSENDRIKLLKCELEGYSIDVTTNNFLAVINSE